MGKSIILKGWDEIDGRRVILMVIGECDGVDRRLGSVMGLMEEM